MIKIAICDRSKRQQMELLDYIAKNVDIEDDYLTECFDTAEKLEKMLENGDFHYDLLFLGIESDGAERIALAEQIRECKIDTDIIFLAENMDYITEAFRCRAFNYIVKPMSYQIYYIIGASIAGLAILGAFIIYLVKGKKTY